MEYIFRAFSDCVRGVFDERGGGILEPGVGETGGSGAPPFERNDFGRVKKDGSSLPLASHRCVLSRTEIRLNSSCERFSPVADETIGSSPSSSSPYCSFSPSPDGETFFLIGSRPFSFRLNCFSPALPPKSSIPTDFELFSLLKMSDGSHEAGRIFNCIRFSLS